MLKGAFTFILAAVVFALTLVFLNPLLSHIVGVALPGLGVTVCAFLFAGLTVAKSG